MKYAELLSSYISSSGLSLSAISDRLRIKGFSTDKGYISKLQNGKIPPAGDELNIALAQVTGGDEEELIMAAYIEKAPEQVRDLIDGAASIDAVLGKYFSIVMEIGTEPERYLPGYKPGESKEDYFARFNTKEKQQILENAIAARNTAAHAPGFKDPNAVTDVLVVSKLQYLAALERELGIDLTDPEVQKKIKMAAKIVFADEA